MSSYETNRGKETQFELIPPDWEIVKLEDALSLLTDGSHFSPKEAVDSPYYISSVKDLGKYSIKIDTCKGISKDDYDRLVRSGCKPEVGDILFSKDGTMGVCFVYKQNMPVVVLSSIAILRPNKDFDSYFLKQYLSNKTTLNLIISEHSSGSALPRLTLTNLKSIPVIKPPIAEQRKIGKILSNLDLKIELNHQMNKTLESIAQAIFKHWFIDFEFPDKNGQPYKSNGGEMVDSEWGSIPERWKYSNLKSVLSKLESGSRPKGGSVPLGIPSIGAENINGLGNYNYSSTKYVPVDYFKGMKSGKVLDFDVLLYKDGANIGRKSMFALGFPFDKLCVNEHVFILRSNEILNQYYLYFWLDLANITEAIVKLNTNSAQPGINKQGVDSIPILVPDNKLVEKFRIIVDPLMKSIFLNSKESHTISNIRDTLLPKLISGKIRVPVGDANE